MSKNSKIEAYEVWRVPNGSLFDFFNGINSNCEWIGDGFENFKAAKQFVDECNTDNERYACSHHIVKSIRDNSYNLIRFDHV